MKLSKINKLYRVPTKGTFKLKDIAPDDKGDLEDKEGTLLLLREEQEKLKELQNTLYAQAKHAVLIVFQAMDTGGKDGCIRRTLGPLNPQGVRVTNFKAPTAEELRHDYLWRIHQAVPAKGMIGVFNRSHYEDVLIARVHKLAPKKELDLRYRQINDFEQHLAENGVTILKFYLHISKEEQAERLQERLDIPEKHWKFNVGDLDERKLWGNYMDAYERMLTRCSPRHAPWYVVPANRKWVRNYIVVRTLRETLEGLKLAYPDPAEGLDEVVIEE